MDEVLSPSQQLLTEASVSLLGFTDHVLDVIEVARPPDMDYAILLAKTVSKLSPIIGNMLEYAAVSYLNQTPRGDGHWIRQDPGFPDTIFQGTLSPPPGIEIKTWFPLATEITARFKDSVTHFAEDQTNVAMLAWVPEFIIFGRPKILDVWVCSARSVAQARDLHYHRPPGYLVLEPEDTSTRTRNLQQTNTNGYKFQGSAEQLIEAERVVAAWGPTGITYLASGEYQAMVRTLLSLFPYRLDTNFAKMDRIRHAGLELFKQRVCRMSYAGRTISQWTKLLSSPEAQASRIALRSLIEKPSGET